MFIRVFSMDNSNHISVCYVFAAGLTWSVDSDDISDFHAEISGDRVFFLDSRQLILFDHVLIQKQWFLLLFQDAMLWHKLMFSDVHLEIFQSKFLDGKRIRVLKSLGYACFVIKYQNGLCNIEHHTSCIDCIHSLSGHFVAINAPKDIYRFIS